MSNYDPNNPWLEHSNWQVSHPTVQAFGITLTSRHSRAIELAEMLKFAHALTIQQLNLEVIEVFYDSGSGCASIRTRVPVDPFGPVGRAIKAVALQCLSQFDWHGQVLHGDGVHGPLPPEGPDEEVPF